MASIQYPVHGGTGLTSYEKGDLLVGKNHSTLGRLPAGQGFLYADPSLPLGLGYASITSVASGVQDEWAFGDVVSLSSAIVLTGQTTGTVVGSGFTVDILDASYTQKGIASFDATNFTVVNGAVDTIQDIATTSSPTFAAVTITGLTATRLVFAGTGGLLSGSSNLTWSSNVLTIVGTGQATVLTDGTGIMTGGVVTGAAWQGQTVQPQYGGTGISSYTAGDLLYATGATTLEKLSVDGKPDGSALVLEDGLPAWAESATALPKPSAVGQVLYCIDGESFEVALPVTNKTDGWLINSDGFLIVTRP